MPVRICAFRGDVEKGMPGRQIAFARKEKPDEKAKRWIHEDSALPDVYGRYSILLFHSQQLTPATMRCENCRTEYATLIMQLLDCPT